MEIAIIVILLIVAALSLFYAFSSRSANTSQAIEQATQNATLSQALHSEQAIAAQCREKADELTAQINILIAEKADLKAKNEALIDASNKIKEQIAALQEQSKEEIKAMQEQTKEQFKNLANEILEDKSQRFTAANRDNLDKILSPFKEQIKDFHKLVTESYDKEGRERSELKGLVEAMRSANEAITKEAKNLTKALKGESKTQGCWGEMILASILENSGLTKGEQYETEEVIRDEQGRVMHNESTNQMMRPDATIKFPGKRVVFIDSKVTLNAAIDYHNAQSDEEAEQSAKTLVHNVMRHIDQLSARNYDTADQTLDFVMMFIPNESAYVLAIKTKTDLWNYAYNKRIMLVSPSTLIISLKMCQDLWRQESRNRNAEEIAKRGGLLYDKLASFVDDMTKLKSRLDSANKEYDAAMNKLAKGKGNALFQAVQLRELGITTQKTIAYAELTDDSDNTLLDLSQSTDEQN